MSFPPRGDETAHDNNKAHDTLIPKENGPGPHGSAQNYSTLHYRHRSLWLLAFYIPLLIIPWTLTCVLVHHPANLPSYFDQSGFSRRSIDLHTRLINAVAVLNSIASIVTIPIISALLAQAAVVYTQRRRKSQSVSIRQTFALADRGWSNLGILWEAWPPWKEHDVIPKGYHARPQKQERQRRWAAPGSGFLWLAALFLLICGIQQPIREGVVSSDQIRVVSQSDNHVSKEFRSMFYDTIDLIGYDPEPDDLSTIPEDVVVPYVANTLASLTRFEIPPYLWPDYGSDNPFDYTTSLGKRYGPWSRPQSGFFVAAIPENSTTGVLRHRAMRLNSTVACEEIDRSAFPSSCGGERPFTSSFKRDQLEVRVCAPGQRGLFPWKITRDRQDISEEFFIDATGSSNGSKALDITRQCTVRTTRGYFELGNYRNDDTHGPLLERWIEPDPFAKEGEYNDWLAQVWSDNSTITDRVRNLDFKWRRPSTENKLTDIPGWPVPRSSSYDNSPWPATPGSNGENLTMPGPLMTSIITLFGDRSLFALANATTDDTAAVTLAQICQSGRMPFSAFNDHKQYLSQCAATEQNDVERLTSIIDQFVASTFNDTVSGIRYLSASVYFANQAMLLQTAAKTEAYTARPIYTGQGIYIPKPAVSTTGIAVISALLFAQLLGLAYLAYYMYTVPTWTPMLDALAVARITNSLDKTAIPAIGSMSDKDLQRLNELDGLVGVVETHADEVGAGYEGVGKNGQTVELGLGASGLFNRRLVKFRVKRGAVRMDMECQCEGCRRRRVRTESGSMTSSTY